MKRYWILTLDGKPAVVIDGQIYFARTHYRGAGIPASDVYDSAVKAMRAGQRAARNRPSNWDFRVWRMPIDVPTEEQR